MAKRTKKNEDLTLEEKLEQAFIPDWDEPYKLPDNWCWAKFGYLSNIRTGKKDANYGSENGEYPFFTCATDPIRCDDYSFDCHAILLAGNGDISNISIYNGKFEAYQRTYVVEAKDIDIQYAYYYFKYKWVDYNKDKMYGSAIPYIRLGNLQVFPFPIAPFCEQRRIVEYIEAHFAKLDEAKEKAQEVVDGFENRKAAILHKAFTGELTKKWRKENNKSIYDWKTSTIGDIADVKGGKRVPKGMTLTSQDTGHPYIKAGNLKNGTVIDDEMMYVPDDVLPYIKNYTVNAGDVYITNVGACIGDCGIIPVKYHRANLTENAVKIINYVCDGEYLALHLACNAVQQKIKELTASATLGKLSIAKIKTIEIHLPSREEQIEIVSIIKRIFAKNQVAKEKSEEVIEQIHLIKKAILARAFRGELGTNNPGEESAIELLKEILKGDE